MIERLPLLFRMKSSPFSQEFRDDLGTLRDSVMHLHGLVKIANQSAQQVRNELHAEPKLNMFARISASVSPFTGENSASCWQYQWSEVVWDRSSASWSNPLGPRNSTAFSNAINIYETTTPNSGDNVPAVAGTTITRLPIQNGRVVHVTVEPSGFVWFDRQNPVQVGCP
jgi:hypothetical protein